MKLKTIGQLSVINDQKAEADLKKNGIDKWGLWKGVCEGINKANVLNGGSIKWSMWGYQSKRIGDNDRI